MKGMDMVRIVVRCLCSLLGAFALAACERQPTAPSQVVDASNEAVLQCSVDTDCMINRVCDGGQCKVRKASMVNTADPSSEATMNTARHEAEAGCLAYAKAYMNSAVAAGLAEMPIPPHSGNACSAPTTILTLHQIQNGATIEFVPKAPGVMRTHCDAASATCRLTQSENEWLSSVPEAAQVTVGAVQPDDAAVPAAEGMLEADGLAQEQERARLERERVAEEKRLLERERRDLERQRKKIAEQRAVEQAAREREEQEIARRQAEAPDALYESRRHTCAKGFLGSNCRKRIREQVCDGHWSADPPQGYSTCKLKQPVVTIEARKR